MTSDLEVKIRKLVQLRLLKHSICIKSNVFFPGVTAYNNAAMTWEPINHDQEMASTSNFSLHGS